MCIALRSRGRKERTHAYRCNITGDVYFHVDVINLIRREIMHRNIALILLDIEDPNVPLRAHLPNAYLAAIERKRGRSDVLNLNIDDQQNYIAR